VYPRRLQQVDRPDTAGIRQLRSLLEQLLGPFVVLIRVHLAHPDGRQCAAAMLTGTSDAERARTVRGPAQHEAVTDDEPAPTTVRHRFTAAGLSDERIEQHMTAGRVHVDGEVVTDPYRPASPPRPHRFTAP
jgi:hypothetical protein